MAKVDVARAGTYIIMPRKQFRRLMKYLNENPYRKSYPFSIKGWYDVEIFPEDYKTGLASLRG